MEKLAANNIHGQPKLFSQITKLLEATNVQVVVPVVAKPPQKDLTQHEIDQLDLIEGLEIKNKITSMNDRPKRLKAEQPVVNMLADIAIDYMSLILKDSLDYYEHRVDMNSPVSSDGNAGAVKKAKLVDTSDVKLAILSQNHYHFVHPPPREFLLEIAAQKNTIPLADSLGNYLNRTVLDPGIFKGFRVSDDGTVTSSSYQGSTGNNDITGSSFLPSTIKQLQKKIINDTVKSNRYDYLLPLERFCQLNPNYQLKDFEQILEDPANDFALEKIGIEK